MHDVVPNPKGWVWVVGVGLGSTACVSESRRAIFIGPMRYFVFFDFFVATIKSCSCASMSFADSESLRTDWNSTVIMHALDGLRRAGSTITRRVEFYGVTVDKSLYFCNGIRMLCGQ